MILSLKESEYWTNFMNCKLNLTNDFNKDDLILNFLKILMIKMKLNNFYKC